MEPITLALLGLGTYALWVFRDTSGWNSGHISSPEERFDAKIKRFGWDKPSEQDNVIKKQVKQTSQSEISLENKILLSFLDKHFDLFSIDSELYALNLNQLKDEQHVSMNHRLRAVLELKGLYDFEINTYIINGSDATRMHMADNVR